MSKVDAIVARCTERLDDLHLEWLRALKEADPTLRAVGHLPVYAPRPLVAAAGMLPVAIFGGGDAVDVVKGDAYFQSYICHLPRSVIDLALNGAYQPLDAMLFPATCDVIRNLSGMWQVLFPKVLSRYVDVPQCQSVEAGADFMAGELAALGSDLEGITGRPIDEERIRESIADYNRNAAAIAELFDLRAEAPWRYPLREVYSVIRAGGLMPIAEHTSLLRDYVTAATERDLPYRDLSRVLVIGAFCEQPPVNLLVTLERAGCGVVDDDLLLGLRWQQEPLSEQGDPLAAIARGYMESSPSTASVYDLNDTKGMRLIEMVRGRDADGVVFCAPSFCDPALLDRPMLQRALDDADIPHTALQYAENTGQFQVIREQAGTFSDAIKLWSHA